MVIPGTQIADSIKERLRKKISSLSVIPHLAVVIIGNDPSSIVYINRKKKVGEEIGMKVTVFRLSSSDKVPKLLKLLKSLNEDKTVHGIIIQRPVPLNIKREELDILVSPQKDVDGFHPNSKFQPPIGSAILEILKWVYSNSNQQPTTNNQQLFSDWLVRKKILVIGRGETGGAPIIKTLQKMGLQPSITHSKTENVKELCLQSDIIISCVGKENIVRHDMVTKNTVLIGVGMHPLEVVESADPEKIKFAPDYDVDEIKDIVEYYTPVPGGVGPVNVASLLKNVVKAVRND